MLVCVVAIRLCNLLIVHVRYINAGADSDALPVDAQFDGRKELEIGFKGVVSAYNAGKG